MAAKNRLFGLILGRIENLELTYRIVEFSASSASSICLMWAFRLASWKKTVLSPGVIAGASRPEQIDANIKAAVAKLFGGRAWRAWTS